jgi:hypothetical protein
MFHPDSAAQAVDYDLAHDFRLVGLTLVASVGDDFKVDRRQLCADLVTQLDGREVIFRAPD